MTQTRTPELADIIRQAIEDRLADVHVMLPGRIDAYDAAKQKADVEPLIKRLQSTVDGELAEDLPIIPGVPVMFPRAGGFKLTMPVSPGDRCMLIFCERSIETYQIGQGRRGSSALINQSDPDTFEMHSLSDPVALMGWYNDAEALSSSDQDGVQLGEDGGPIIHIGGDLVELYEKGASEFVALAAKTDQRIGDLEQSLISHINTVFNVHLHTEVTSIFPGPAAPTSPPITSGTAPTPGSSVAAEKVKAT
jgi:hypothetical protein